MKIFLHVFVDGDYGYRVANIFFWYSIYLSSPPAHAHSSHSIGVVVRYHIGPVQFLYNARFTLASLPSVRTGSLFTRPESPLNVGARSIGAALGTCPGIFYKELRIFYQAITMAGWRRTGLVGYKPKPLCCNNIHLLWLGTRRDFCQKPKNHQVLAPVQNVPSVHISQKAHSQCGWLYFHALLSLSHRHTDKVLG